MSRRVAYLATLALIAVAAPASASHVLDGLDATVNDLLQDPTSAADVEATLGTAGGLHEDRLSHDRTDEKDAAHQDEPDRTPRDDGQTRSDAEDEAERQSLLGLRDDVVPAGPPGSVDHLIQKNVREPVEDVDLLDRVHATLHAAVTGIYEQASPKGGPSATADASIDAAAERAAEVLAPAAAQAPFAASALLGAAVVAAPGTGAGNHWWRRFIGALAGYTRLRRASLLDQDVRASLHEVVQANPGVPTPQLAEKAEVSRATATYHLRVLEREGYLTSRRVGRARHYFPAGATRRLDPEAEAALQHPTTGALANLVEEVPGVDQSTLCERLGLSPSLAHWHLQRLVEVGVVEKRRDGRRVRYHPSA